jgi:hypothetical protein
VPVVRELTRRSVNELDEATLARSTDDSDARDRLDELRE